MSEEFSFEVKPESIEELKKAINYDELNEISKRFDNGTETEDDIINHCRNYGIEFENGNQLFVVEKKYFDKVVDLYQKEKEKNKELKKENNEIRDWKYTIDTVEDLYLLTRLDNIKIKGKEYISKDIYSELEKDKKALIKNYDKVLSQFISKDKIKELLEKYDKDIAWDTADDHYYFTKFIKELLEENNEKQM